MDASAEISELKTKVAALEADTKNLVGWQKEQNGALVRMADRVEKLQFWMMTQAVALLGTLVVGLLVFLLKK